MTILLHRISALLWQKRFSRLSYVLDRVNLLLTGNFVPGSAQIGVGSKFAYGGISCVIHKNACIGSSVLIGQSITIGAKEAFASSQPLKSPVVGNNCYLAAGCRILGGITVGDNCIVATNAVVLHDVPPNSIVGGIPAKVIGMTDSDYKAIRP